jgi:hypothetical protein
MESITNVKSFLLSMDDGAWLQIKTQNSEFIFEVYKCYMDAQYEVRINFKINFNLFKEELIVILSTLIFNTPKTELPKSFKITREKENLFLYLDFDEPEKVFNFWERLNSYIPILNYTITTEGTYRFKNKKEEPK